MFSLLQRRSFRVLLVACLALAAGTLTARCCPFCQTISQTFSEQIEADPVAVFAKMIEGPKDKPDATPADGLDVTPPMGKFEIVQVLKGKDSVVVGKTFDSVYFGDLPVGSEFLFTAIEPPKLIWSPPVGVNERARRYILGALKLPKEGADRLAYFQDFLEDKDESLNRDAYDEFAKTPFSGVRELKDRMHHDKIVEWIKNPEIPPSRRRLYFTMLSVCGTDKDVPMLEEMLRTTDRKQKGGLDAMISCYLMLRGADGMPLVEDLFLRNKKAEYVDTYAAVMALRFQGQEETQLPKERILEGFRLMLDRPELADLVIPDLARWQDWSVMDRLVELFKKADDSSNWIRIPVVNYLRACPEPKAKQYLEELAAIDPETIKRANAFFPLGDAGGGAPASVPASSDTSGRPPKSKTGDAPKADDKKSFAPAPVPTTPSGKNQTDKNQTGTNGPGSPSVATGSGLIRSGDAPSILSPDSPWFYVLTIGLAAVIVGLRRGSRYWMQTR